MTEEQLVVEIQLALAEAGKPAWSAKKVRKAVAIAKAESGLDPNAVGDTTITTSKWGPSIGVFQIRSLKAHSGTGKERDATRLKDVRFNVRSMLKISSYGRNWTPWSVYTSGKYKQYLDDNYQATGILGEEGAIGGAVFDFGKFFDFITAGAIWIRVSLVVLGGILLLAGLFLIANDLGMARPIKKVAKVGTKVASKGIL